MLESVCVFVQCLCNVSVWNVCVVLESVCVLVQCVRNVSVFLCSVGVI